MIRFGVSVKPANGRFDDEDYEDLTLSPSVSRVHNNNNNNITLISGDEGIISYSKTDDEAEDELLDQDNILSTSTSGDESSLSHQLLLLGDSQDQVNISSQIDDWCLDNQLHSVRSPSVTLSDVHHQDNVLWTSGMLDNLSESHLERIRQFAFDFLPILKESRRSCKRIHDKDEDKITKRIRIPTLFNKDILGCSFENISLNSDNSTSYIDVWSSPYLNISYSDLT